MICTDSRNPNSQGSLEKKNDKGYFYIVPKTGETQESIPPEEIIAFCRERIAAFKVPRYIEYRQEFSITPSGKIQKHVLLTEKEDLADGCYDRFKVEFP
ncbi:MAG: hypothetical protein JRD49_03770 [Deltaproteobacteria bacterium]|nr:hypothetical protein [Deltaproteobacteria bacterium]MBW2676664.1 hypothetical protein [Deltaproteobacteria bacterium]